MVFNIRKGSPLRSRIWRSRLTVAASGLALCLAACDADKTPGQTGTAGTSGAAGTGGSPAGAAGTGGSVGTAGTGGSPAGAGGAGGGGATGTGGGTAGSGGTAAPFVDTDVVLARFNANGTLDSTFGTQGVARLDLGAGAQVGGRDTPWGIAKDAEDRLHVFAARKNTNGRTDTDRVAARLSKDGVLDTTFGDANPNQSVRTGMHTLDVGNVNDSTRNGFVQPDGKIVTSGYMGQATGVGAQTSNRIVLARLNGGSAAAPIPGTLDTTFGVSGIVSSNPFSSTDPLMPWGTAEAYGIARQSTGAYVTGGYGRSAATGTVNVLSFRYTAAGGFDTTWGTTGVFEKDVAGEDDRARNVAVLPDDRVLLVGSSAPAAGNVDGMIMILTANGALDTTFNTTGYKTYKFDATIDRADEALYGAALSPNGMFAAVAGYRGPGPTGSNTNNDAALVVLPLGGTGTEFAAAVPLSATADDRFWAVTFDANNKIVAAGYLTEGTDRWLAVARFNTDGTPDGDFGTNGVTKVNATVAGNLEEARGVVVQSDGKIVVGGTAEH